MNSMSLKTKINNISKSAGTSPQELMQMYFFERILYRISISDYKDNFILKGGLLLSSILKDSNRTTQDMDTMIKGLNIEKEKIIKIIKKILSITVNDNIVFEVIGSKTIREENLYGGIRVNILGTIETLKVNLHIDVTTGDPIVPKEIDYNYKSIINDEIIKIKSFSKYTIIAEKFETLMEMLENDTRSKDMYDIYMLLNENVDYKILKKAIISTFKYREKEHLLENINERLEIIKESKKLPNYWNNYAKTHKNASNINYSDILIKIEKIIDLM